MKRTIGTLVGVFGLLFFLVPMARAITAEVPATGQTTSFAPGDDGDLQRGVALPTPRFTDNLDGTITDNLTGLIWLQNAGCVRVHFWALAVRVANGLASGDCGLSDGSVAGDWRLPNIRELHSLVNFGFFRPALSDAAGTGQGNDSDPFSNFPPLPSLFSVLYWSSTTVASTSPFEHFAWGVNFFNGSVDFDSKNGDFLFDFQFVLAVRGGS